MAKKSKEGNIDLFYMDANKKSNVKNRRAEKKSAPKSKVSKKKISKNKSEISDEVFNFNTEFVLGITDKEKENSEKKKKQKEKNRKTKDKKNQKNFKNKKMKTTNRESTDIDPVKENIERLKNRTSAANVENKINSEKVNKPKSKKKKKSNRIKKLVLKFIKWTILIGIIIAAIAFIMSSPMFNLKQIVVEGNQLISSDEIIGLSELKIDDNLFNNRKNKIIDKIKKNAYIEDVQITRRLPDKITIKIEERTPAYAVQVMNGYAYLDKQGHILEVSENKPELPLLSGINTSEENIISGNRLDNDDLEKLNIILKIMNAADEIKIKDIISEINCQDKNEYNIYIESKKKIIYIGDASNLTNKMLYVQAILQAEEGNEGEIFVNGNLTEGFQPFFREKV